MELARLLQQVEGKTLEFKREVSSTEGIARTAVAFANTAGGTILVGVEDETRNVRGVEDPWTVEQQVASVITDRIAPRILPDIEVLAWRKKHVVAVRIHPSSGRPHHLNSEGPTQGVYVRVGSTNRRADQALIREMQRYSQGVAFDELPVPDLTADRIDFTAATEAFAPARKLGEADLETLGIMTVYQGHRVPTNGGMLLFGVDRLGRYPDAWVKLARFQSTDRSVFSDRQEIRLPLPQTVEACIGFIDRHTIRSAEIGRSRRIDKRYLPAIAIREAVINAIAHADYSQQAGPLQVAIFNDRLEIENPGLLPFGLSLEDLPRGTSKVRNRVIARAFNELGLIEQWGSGIQRMRTACLEAGLREPEFEEVGIRFRATLFLQPVAKPKLSAADQAVISAISRALGSTTSDVATKLSLTTRTIRTRLARLVARGLVREVGSSPNDPKRRYYLTDRPE